MIDWWAVLGSALWISGLAVELATVSLASHRAGEAGRRLREKLAEPSVLLPLQVGLGLFCTGLLLISPAWWQRILSGLLAAFFWLQVLRRPPRMSEIPRADAECESQPGVGRHRGWWLGWSLLIAGLLLLATWTLVTGLQLRPRLRSLQAHLAALESFVTDETGGPALGLWDPANREAAGQHLNGIHADLAAIEDRIGPLLPLGRLLRWVPGRGDDLAASAELLELATRVSAAGQQTLEALTPMLEAVSGAPGSPKPLLSSLPEIVPLAETARPGLASAQQELVAVSALRAQLRADRLSPQWAGYLEQLDHLLPLLEAAVDGTMALPDLLGADEARTYLVLVQNSDELRATGGFLSGVGELRLADGHLALSRFDDSYAVDNLAVPHELAPPDLQQTLHGDLWLLRDTNWDPDFVVSARRAIKVYARDRGVQADGALALDLVALQGLLSVLGPLDLEGSAEPVTAQNVERAIQAGWDRSAAGGEGEWWQHRKDLMGEIASEAIRRLATGSGVALADLASALGTALREKHLLVYVSDASAADLFGRQGWDGALRVPDRPSDQLLVVDSNVGFNKADANVDRFADYRVDLTAAGRPRVKLALTYRHQGAASDEPCLQEARYGDTYRDMTERCYWDYVRVYVPTGSRLLSAPDLELPPGSLAVREGGVAPQSPLHPAASREGWQVWAEFFALAPGTERTLTFGYELPRGPLEIDASGLVHYRLLVQKQPGTEAVPLRLQITLPPGAEVVRTVPAELAPELVLITDLRMDRQFELVFRRQ